MLSHRSEENHFKSFITLFCTSVSNQSLSKKNWTTVLFLCATRWRRKGQKENIGWMKVNNRGCIWVEENDWRSLTRMREREKESVWLCVFMTEREWRVKTWANPGLFLVYLTFSPFPPSTQHGQIERTQVRYPKSEKFYATIFSRTLYLPCSCHLNFFTCDTIFKITMLVTWCGLHECYIE